jgi:hypothetical protein
VVGFCPKPSNVLVGVAGHNDTAPRVALIADSHEADTVHARGELEELPERVLLPRPDDDLQFVGDLGIVAFMVRVQITVEHAAEPQRSAEVPRIKRTRTDVLGHEEE